MHRRSITSFIIVKTRRFNMVWFSSTRCVEWHQDLSDMTFLKEVIALRYVEVYPLLVWTNRSYISCLSKKKLFIVRKGGCYRMLLYRGITITDLDCKYFFNIIIISLNIRYSVPYYSTEFWKLWWYFGDILLKVPIVVTKKSLSPNIVFIINILILIFYIMNIINFLII